MTITNEQLNQFQALWKAKFGTEIPREEACEKAVKLVRLMEIIYRPMQVEHYTQVLEHQKLIRQKYGIREDDTKS